MILSFHYRLWAVLIMASKTINVPSAAAEKAREMRKPDNVSPSRGKSVLILLKLNRCFNKSPPSPTLFSHSNASSLPTQAKWWPCHNIAHKFTFQHVFLRENESLKLFQNFCNQTFHQFSVENDFNNYSNKQTFQYAGSLHREFLPLLWSWNKLFKFSLLLPSNMKKHLLWTEAKTLSLFFYGLYCCVSLDLFFHFPCLS